MTITFQELVAAQARLKEAVGSVRDFSWPVRVMIVEDHNLVLRRQVRFPRSKKRRIRAKWAKQPANWAYVANPRVFRMGDQLVCHPVIARALREKFKEAR